MIWHQWRLRPDELAFVPGRSHCRGLDSVFVAHGRTPRCEDDEHESLVAQFGVYSAEPFDGQALYRRCATYMQLAGGAVKYEACISLI